MPDILSTEEINSLLSVFRDMGVSQSSENNAVLPKRVSSYDFTRPEILGKDHLRALHSIHSKYAQHICNALFGNVNVPAIASLVSMDQMSYSEYISMMSEESISYNAFLAANMPVFVLDISLPLASSCIDSLTGGDGVSFDSVSDLSDIDLAILNKAIIRIAHSYQCVWGIQSESSIDSPKCNPTRNEFLPNESVFVVCFEVRTGSMPGLMHICLPFSLIKNLLPSSPEPALHSEPEVISSPEIQQILHETLQDVPLECKAILGRTILSTRDIINLQEGDIIRLDDDINSEIELWVGEKLAYSATPGQSGKNIGLRITRDLSQP